MRNDINMNNAQKHEQDFERKRLLIKFFQFLNLFK